MSNGDDIEQWRSIAGWEGFYEVSDQGRVRSVDRFIWHPISRKTRRSGRILTQAQTPKGYFNVALCRNGRKETRFAHRIVLEAFVGPRPNGAECLHRNGNPGDNRIGNIHWGTASANSFDKVLHGTHHQARKTHCTTCWLPYDLTNTYWCPNGARGCRNCRNRRTREYRARMRQRNISMKESA